MIVRHLLAPRVDSLRRTSPRLVPEFISAPGRTRLVERDADLAVRLADPGEPSLIARRIGKVRFELYAPDSVRAVHRTVRTADHWLPLPWIGWTSEFASLPIARCVANLLPIESQVGAANALLQQLVLARALGAALVLPSFLAQYEPGLRRVEAAPSPLLEEPIWLVVNQEFRGTPAAKAAIAWIKANLIDLR
jgi:DNA-binding transcriptional LysR family regulator